MTTTNTRNLRTMLVLLAIAATLVTASTLIFNPQLAQAQSGKFLDGRGTGELRCLSAEGEPGSSPPVEVSIFLVVPSLEDSSLGTGVFLQT